MRHLATAAFAVAALSVATPAAAAVNVLATNVDFAAAPFTFGVTPNDTFTFTFAPQGQFDPSPVLVQTQGTAQVTSFFGSPSVFFTNPPVTFGPNTFPGFGSVPTPTRASFTLTDSDLGLRYSVGSDFFYGYARFAGSQIESIAFETSPNTPILAGAMGNVAAVPEPATWAMMIIGMCAVGGAMRMRRRNTAKVRYA